jgi:hypothetical protein
MGFQIPGPIGCDLHRRDMVMGRGAGGPDRHRNAPRRGTTPTETEHRMAATGKARILCRPE